MWYNIPIFKFAQRKGICHDGERCANRGTVDLWDIYGKDSQAFGKERIYYPGEADEFSKKLFEQLDIQKIPGFLPSPLGEKMYAEDVRVNPYAPLIK